MNSLVILATYGEIVTELLLEQRKTSAPCCTPLNTGRFEHASLRSVTVANADGENFKDASTDRRLWSTDCTEWQVLTQHVLANNKQMDYWVAEKQAFGSASFFCRCVLDCLHPPFEHGTTNMAALWLYQLCFSTEGSLYWSMRDLSKKTIHHLKVDEEEQCGFVPSHLRWWQVWLQSNVCSSTIRRTAGVPVDGSWLARVKPSQGFNNLTGNRAVLR